MRRSDAWHADANGKAKKDDKTGPPGRTKAKARAESYGESCRSLGFKAEEHHSPPGGEGSATSAGRRKRKAPNRLNISRVIGDDAIKPDGSESEKESGEKESEDESTTKPKKERKERKDEDSD